MALTERYAGVAGAGAHDGTSEANAWTMAEAIAGVAAGQRVNVKAGTYPGTTTSLAFAAAGTTTAPIVWRGYKTTIGDMDTASHGTFISGVDVPALTFTTGQVNVTGSYQQFANLDVQGAQTTNGQVRTATGSMIQFDRCRIECTATNSGGRAASIAAVRTTMGRCWLKSSSSADITAPATNTAYVFCAFEGGANGIVSAAGSTCLVAFCAFNNTGGDAIRSTVANNTWFLLFNSFYSPSSDGVEQTADPTTGGGLLAGNIFSECGGYGINASAATTSNFVRMFNLFHSNTSGSVNGLGDWPAAVTLTDGSSPFANAAGGDLSLVSGSSGKGVAPGAFEGQSYSGYLDAGAVQREEPAGGGGTVYVPRGGVFSHIRES